MSPAALAIKQMSHAEKLRAMEELWDELCHSVEGVPSPAWHGEVLAERKARADRGEARWHDWDEVKARLLHPKE